MANGLCRLHVLAGVAYENIMIHHYVYSFRLLATKIITKFEKK
jgi:hypothetical protein